MLEPLSKWHMFGVGDYASKVCVGGEERYQLIYHSELTAFRMMPIYILCDMEGRELCRWSFKQRLMSMDLDVGLEPDFPMLYRIDAIGRRRFTTSTEKMPPYFKVTEKSKSIELDGMKFEHRDYQDKISFSCPPERLQQAIIIAELLFIPPLTDQGQASG